MKIEVVYALPSSEGYYVSAQVPEGVTAEQALAFLDFFRLYPEVDLIKNKIGIYGKLVSRNYILTEGDRLEIYRPIYVDVKAARLKAVNPKKAK
jgi:putative ubiquitin-RnfH superfamily antitoxin RatB of RatAB toxin-antitoxin module